VIRFFNVYYPTRTVLLLLGEAALVAACFLLACQALLGADTSLVLFYEDGWQKITAITVVVVGLSYYFDLYEPQIVSASFEIYFRILLVLGFSCLLLAVAVFFWPAFSLTQNNIYTLSIALLAPALIFWRKAYEYVVNLPFFRERVYVLGCGEQAKNIVELIQARRDVGMEVVDWKPMEGVEDKQVRKAAWIEDLKTLDERKPRVQRVIVAVEDSRNELPIGDLLNARFRGYSVERVGELKERLVGKIQLNGLVPSNLLYSEGFRIHHWQQALRVLASASVALVLLTLFLPFFPFVVLLIRLTSKGPIFFRQTRVGVGGKPFYVYKFRSMRTDAEAAGAKWAVKNDPRVTAFGMFMRKTRIDEIPQLWNVLRGDMGLVGPRPERPEFIPYLVENLPFYDLRHLIRPGLTGWAQVRYGYGATLEEAREKLEYDLYYVKHMSLGLDLLIMFETIKIIIRRRGAQ
jgi:sugar transferase (PEP-CTERM system associated)